MKWHIKWHIQKVYYTVTITAAASKLIQNTLSLAMTVQTSVSNWFSINWFNIRYIVFILPVVPFQWGYCVQQKKKNRYCCWSRCCFCCYMIALIGFAICSVALSCTIIRTATKSEQTPAIATKDTHYVIVCNFVYMYCIIAI